MLEVDNAGNSHCAFLAFAKGLIWLIQGELKHGGNCPLFDMFCQLPFVDEQAGFLKNPSEFIQDMNLKANSSFLQRVQAALREILVELYLTELQKSLNAVEFAEDNQFTTLISANDNITELLAAVYDFLNGKIPSQNDFFRDGECQKTIRLFVPSLKQDEVVNGIIVSSRLREFVLSVFLHSHSNEGPSTSSLFNLNSVGVVLIKKKLEDEWGTFSDLNKLAGFFNVNLVVVNREASVASSLQDARPKIYLHHMTTKKHRADHWTTVLNIFPYCHVVSLSDKVREFETNAYSFNVSKFEIKKIFQQYIQHNSIWFCCFNTRHHLKLAEQVIGQCEEVSQSPEAILRELVAHPPAAYNPQGEFAAMMDYLCYRQFGLNYRIKCDQLREGYEELLDYVSPTQEDLACCRLLKWQEESYLSEPSAMCDFTYMV